MSADVWFQRDIANMLLAAYSNHTRSIGTLQADAFFVASERAREHGQATIDVETTTTDITAGGSGLLARRAGASPLAAQRVDTTGDN